MSKFERKKTMPRYVAFVVIIICVAIMVLVKASYIMTGKRDYWMKVAARQKKDSVIIKPARGNILSATGLLMASSLPEYKIYIDFQQIHDAKSDSIWQSKLDSVCQGLHEIFPQQSAGEFKRHLTEGYKNHKRHWPIWKRRIDYDTFTDVTMLPFFNLSKLKSGFHFEEYNSRQKPYGSLAGRTIGELYGAKDTAKNGLELAYDSILRGTNGIIHRRKILSKYLNITDTPPINGADIVTTIDVGIQDLAEKALIDELKLINANVGVALVMEVKTGDIKAIVNMQKTPSGNYAEMKNHAISDLLEPGSVFKTASIMVALDDGLIDTTKVVNTGGGIWPMYGATMRDHNWRRGGYGPLTVPQILQKSSNIGVSRIIDDCYKHNPEKFVKGIYKLGLGQDLGINLPGAAKARIRMPKKNKRGQWLNWSKTSLPWMSIGYETQVPPIATLTFYNAIANNGKMLKPRFVKKIVKGGKTIREFPVETLKGHEQIAKPQTLKKIRTILEEVVSIGLGKTAGSKLFKVAGKTGTAQVSKGSTGYKSGAVNYLVSFAGYFPADDPMYSCIVCIQKTGQPASGGTMSGAVFHDIAEGIMAKSLKIEAKEAKDSTGHFMPQVKRGNLSATQFVLEGIGYKTRGSQEENNKKTYGYVTSQQNSYTLVKERKTPLNIMPDVMGMGARDAVFMIESRGIRTILHGRGKVVGQSIPSGTALKKDMICTLALE